MAAYPAACILLPAWLARLGITRWVLIPSVIIHGTVWLLMAVVSGNKTETHRVIGTGETSASIDDVVMAPVLAGPMRTPTW